MFFRKLDAHNVYVDLGYFVFGHRLDIVFDRLLYLESDVGHVVSVIDRNGDLGRLYPKRSSVHRVCNR